MTIRNMLTFLGLGIAVAVALGALLAGQKINDIRMGGPIQLADQEVADVLADTLPPPAFLVEPYLEVTQLLRTPAKVRQYKQELASMKAQYAASMDRWAKSGLSEQVKQPLLQDARTHGDAFWKTVDERFLPAIETGNIVAAEQAYDALTRDYDAHRAAITRTVAGARASEKVLDADAQAHLASSLQLLIVLGAGLAVALGGAGLFLMRKVLNPIRQTADVMRAMSQGHLDVALPQGNDGNEIGQMVAAIEVFRQGAIAKAAADLEIAASREAQERVVSELADALQALAEGRLHYRLGDNIPASYEALKINFNEAMASLETTMGEVASTAESVHVGSGEISTASSDLAQRTEHQAASLEETAAAMTQITQSVQSSASNAANVNQAVKIAEADANEGGRIAREAVTAMGRIEQSAQQISEIINLIDGIAFQTNLLALNAGVEAARAGDAGKGFAVVASEVRALAQRSADAAKEIKSLIGESAAHVDGGVRLVSQTGDALDRISARVTEISGLVSEIAHAAQDQAGAVDQVNTVINDMDKTTQQNAAMVEESTAAARSLADEAERLAALVQRFELGNGRDSRAPARKANLNSSPKRSSMPRAHGNLALAEDHWEEF